MIRYLFKFSGNFPIVFHPKIVYNINLANKIISEFIETNKSNKSFSISKKRFIPPHQYLVAKDFIKNEKN